MTDYRTLAQKWDDAVVEIMALRTHERARRKPIGRTRNWGRIMPDGASPRARYNQRRWKKGTWSA